MAARAAMSRKTPSQIDTEGHRTAGNGADGREEQWSLNQEPGLCAAAVHELVRDIEHRCCDDLVALWQELLTDPEND